MGLLSSPNFASKKWIFNQYDQTVMGDTLYGPEQADSAVIRVHGSSKKAIALSFNLPLLGSPMVIKSFIYYLNLLPLLLLEYFFWLLSS